MVTFNGLNRINPAIYSGNLSRRGAPRFTPEPLESRVHLSVSAPPIDGSGNNMANPEWGASGRDFIRLAGAAYDNGINSPALPGDLSARAISNLVNNQDDPNNPGQDLNIPDQKGLSDFGYTFGQFMDHDMDLTRDGGAAFNIPVAAGDPIGPNPLPFTRSQTDPATGTDTDNPAQQVNSSTSYLDLSQVYGSTQVVSDALRTFNDGLLQTSPGNMLPYNNSDYFTPSQLKALDMANDAHLVADTALFATGDRRGNETVELTALQTLFMRNHNRLAGQLKALHGDWTDQQLFDEARKLNIAQYQSIIYNEWIPAVLGPQALPNYSGYDQGVDAAISNEFATVAFRFGHSLLSGEAGRLNNDASPIDTVNPDGPSIELSQDFFDPNLLNPAGVTDPITNQTSSDIGAVLKGAATDNGQAMDMLVVNDVRNLLFGPVGAGGEDLIARDIQRDRDNGIPDYNTLQEKMGLPRIGSFADITNNVQVQQSLANAYGDVNSIDAFEGGLAEDHVAGSEVGPLFQAIMVDQFTRLRDGDRFFYLNEDFTSEERSILQQSDSLTRVIEANTDITNLQANAFYFKVSISGRVIGPFGSFSRGRGGNYGLGSVTVNLEDTSGNILDSTTTTDSGAFRFDGLSIGAYRVREVVPSGYVQLSADPADILVTRGMAVRNVYFLDYNRLMRPHDPDHGQFDSDTPFREHSLSLIDGQVVTAIGSHSPTGSDNGSSIFGTYDFLNFASY